MKKNLFLCNTVYQVFVALWIANLYHRDDENDFIMTDHMNGAEQLAKNAQKTTLVNHSYYVERKKVDQSVDYISCFDSYKKRIHPETELAKYDIAFKKKYDILYIANFDGFSQSLFYTLKRKNKEMILKLFEDGLSTYTTKFEGCYSVCKDPEIGNNLKSRLFQILFPTYGIVGKIDECLLFSPELLQWNPGPIRKLDPIDVNKEDFREIVNTVYNYSSCTDTYDREFIFMEEAYSADRHEIGDVKLIDDLAMIVGKENIMVKIHPRNPRNRFKERGYKTNENTSIPWEVIILNTPELNKKTLITICSASVINPRRLFNMNPKVFSVYHCLDSKKFSGYESIVEVAESLFSQYGIVQCSSVEQVK